MSLQLLTPINGPLGNEKKMYKKTEKIKRKNINRKKKKIVCGIGIPEPVSQGVLVFYP